MLALLFAAAFLDEWPNLYGRGAAAAAPRSVARAAFRGAGPQELWRHEIGTGYSAVAIAGGRLVLFHRLGNEEIVAGLDAATGAPQWERRYPTAYVDRYGYGNGPRATPLLRDGAAYTLGAEGWLHAWKLADGTPLWKRNLVSDFRAESSFFGVGASPAWHEGTLIVNVGAKAEHAGLVGIDAATGKTKWTATDHGASYSTPTVATIHGQPHALALTEAGLVDVDPRDGTVRWEIPFRSRAVESANATGPLVSGDLVLASATYRTGALCVRVLPNGMHEEVWRDDFPDSHFSNLVLADGWVYGFAGRHEATCELFCAELKTGNVAWRAPTAFGRGQLALVGGELLAWGERGRLGTVALDRGKFAATWSGPAPLLKRPTWTPPAFADGRMYLRNEAALVCLDVSGK